MEIETNKNSCEKNCEKKKFKKFLVIKKRKKDEYISAINSMFLKQSVGTLFSYFKIFLLERTPEEWWSQPQVQTFCNKKVVEDGGVEWYTKKGGKKNPDGTPKNFGDPGRQLEKFRTEKYEACWDNQTGKSDGPYRLNLEKYKAYTGPTKCHSFSEKEKETIRKRSGGKCELCGHKGKVEIDHFVPKEKGGLSDLSNANALCSRCNDRKCSKEPQAFMHEEFDRTRTYFTDRGLDFEGMVINKILNEKNNNKLPIEWFCETLLTNFLNICKNVGMLEDCKRKMIKFIQDF